MGFLSFNKAIIASFLAASCAMPQAVTASPPRVQEKSQAVRPPMTPEMRTGLIGLAEIKLEKAKDPANAGLEAWSLLHYVQIYLEYAEYNLNSDDGYKTLGTTRAEFNDMLDKNVAMVLPKEIDEMRKPENKGLSALGAIDLILQGVADLQLTRNQASAAILNGFGITAQEIDKATAEHARLSAQQVLESVKSKDIEGADGWTALIDMLQFMKRAHLDSRSNAGFKAINSSLGEYQQLKRKNAILAVTQAWEKANQPQNTGESALYFLDQVKTYLKRAGYNPDRGEGFHEIKTTKAAFLRLIEKNTGGGPDVAPVPAMTANPA